MKHFRKILVPEIQNIENFIDKIALCQSSDQLNAIISGDVIKKYRTNKPKTIIRIKFKNSYYYLKIRWELSLWRTIKDFIQASLKIEAINNNWSFLVGSKNRSP